jgi:uncharacterized protein
MVEAIQLWRYPVKSMQGEIVEEISLTELGVAGDRTWATRDLVRGGIRGAKQLGGLMSFAAIHPAGATAPIITLPDGSTVAADAPDASDRLSAALDHPVRLEPLAPAGDLDHYRRGPSDDPDPIVGLRATLALEPDEPLPDLSIFPPAVMEFGSPPGTYHDAFPLLLLTTASLAALAELAPSSVIGVRRFRPSILFDAGVGADATGFVEQGWSGRRARIGTATVEVGPPCPRCVMITRAFAEFPADRSLMRVLVRENQQSLGVYASIVEPGLVRTGDTFELLD